MFRGNSPTSSTPDENHRVCPICDGLGVVRLDLPVEDKRFGRLFPCPGDHHDLQREREQRLREISNLSAYSDKTFEDFVTDIPMLTPPQHTSLETAYRVAHQFAEQPEGWLLLEGLYGCGKTHLAAAVGNARLQAGETVLFITVPDLLDYLRSTYGPSSEVGYDELFDRIRNVTLLILDDLGSESPSSWAQEKLYQLLNHRYSRRLPTVITTNSDLDSLDRRIRSRLLDENLIHRVRITAPDYRTSVQIRHQQVSNLALYRDMTFEQFDVQTHLTNAERQNLKRALDAAWDYANRPRGWLILVGPFGCGKTHLAAAIAHRQQQQGVEVIFIPVPDLLDFLRMTYNPGALISYDQRLHQLRTAPLLVLDDLGTENSTPWAREKLFQILDYRYLANLPTIITTARTTEEFEERIRTRLLDRRRCTLFAITAPDYASRINRR